MWFSSLFGALRSGSRQSRKRQAGVPAVRRRPVGPRLHLDQLEDRTLLSSFLVINTGDNGGVNPLPGAGTGTLRQAIVDANAAHTGTAASPDLVQFNIPTTDPGYNSATGAFTIKPHSALPTVTDPVVLDGYTQPGASPNTLAIGDNAVLKVVLDGSLAGTVNGLVIGGGNSTVRGLVIDNFAAGAGIALVGTGSDLVAGNFIGTDVTGVAAAATDNNDGVYTASPGNLIGGTSPAARNIISGTGSVGSATRGVDLESNGNLVQGNYIGTDKSGTLALGTGNGVWVGATSNTIGGTSAGAGNVLSGNVQRGICIENCNQNLVVGNLIGTTANGLAGLGNGLEGIKIFGAAGATGNNNIIGGTTPGARNVISANRLEGIHIEGANPGSGQGNLVEGNYIGTDITGTTALAPQLGISIHGADNNTIGGTTAAARNIISSGGSEGLLIFAPGTFGNVVLGNYLGTDKTGIVALGGGEIVIDGATNNTIGGTAGGAGNTIAFNAQNGVYVASGTGNSILGNSIFANGGPGISLNSANNANNNQAFPVLTSVLSSGSGTTITGTLQSVASTTFRIEFFANAAADSSGYGQGQTCLGFTTLTTTSSGAGSFTFTSTTPLPAGQTIVSATATNLTTGDTSQFCRDVSVPVVGPITAPLAPVAVNTAVNVSASFTDALTTTTHTAVWNWGDGTTSSGTVTETNGSGTVTGSHTYAVDGVYTVTLTVTNNLGGSGQSVFQYVVVFSPSAGFVTGGGWITSPAGAYAASPSLIGKANFGFNVRYQSGSTVPTGQLEFQLPAAGLNFHATGFDWLVVNGNQAQFQGSGTINGAGNYGFLVTVLDGGAGQKKIRIKIWDKSSGAVVYDTQMGGAVTDLPLTLLGGGDLTIHSN
jgi:hypothetical protein